MAEKRTLSVGQYIRRQRKRLGLSQAQLAERLTSQGFVYSSQTVGHWEAGRIAVPLDLVHDETRFLKALALALESSPLEILKVTGYLDGIDLKFDVQTYEYAQLFERATASQQKAVIQILKELVGNEQ